MPGVIPLLFSLFAALLAAPAFGQEPGPRCPFPAPVGAACPGNTYPIGNGFCVLRCAPGEEQNPWDPNDCRKPVSCADGMEEIAVGVCACAGGKVETASGCACPANFPVDINGKCKNLNDGRSDDPEACGGAGVFLNEQGACECEAPYEQYFAGSRRCLIPRRCVGGIVDDQNECVCPEGQTSGSFDEFEGGSESYRAEGCIGQACYGSVYTCRPKDQTCDGIEGATLFRESCICLERYELLFREISACAIPVDCEGGTVTGRNTCECPEGTRLNNGKCEFLVAEIPQMQCPGGRVVSDQGTCELQCGDDEEPNPFHPDWCRPEFQCPQNQEEIAHGVCRELPKPSRFRCADGYEPDPFFEGPRGPDYPDGTLLYYPGGPLSWLNPGCRPKSDYYSCSGDRVESNGRSGRYGSCVLLCEPGEKPDPNNPDYCLPPRPRRRAEFARASGR